MELCSEEAVKYVWEGAIPLQIHLHESEVTTLPPPAPVLVISCQCVFSSPPVVGHCLWGVAVVCVFPVHVDRLYFWISCSHVSVGCCRACREDHVNCQELKFYLRTQSTDGKFTYVG